MSVSTAGATRPAAVEPPLSEIVRLTPEYGQLWDEYVLTHPQATPFHLTAWKRTIEESFPYRPEYLLCLEYGRITGVLPLFFVRNPVIGRVLLSSPFAVYGGILATSDSARRKLYDHTRQLAEELRCDYIEYRNSYPEQCVGIPNVSRYVAFHKLLVPSEEQLLEEIPKKTRNLVRKALKTPFEMRRGIRDTAILDRVHSRNMRRLGTPNFPRRYFDRLLHNFGEMADIREVWFEGHVMAVSLNLYFRGDMHTYHAASDTRFNPLGPNTFLYYDHLRWAGQNGFTTFDFGRCKRNTGVFEFKKHWNTIMRELPYEIVLVKRCDLPNFSPANPKFDLPIRLWRRLPMFVTRTVSRVVFPLFP